jgi:tetratricopeptide (TPR) repeat protein
MPTPPSRGPWAVTLAALLTAAAAGHSWSEERTAEVQFREAYKTVQTADSAYEREDWVKARRLYTQAVEAYSGLRTKYPDWQPGVVDFRLRYCTRRIDLLPQVPPGETDAVTALREPEPAPAVVDAGPSPAERRAERALSNLVDASRRQLISGNASSARDSLIAAMKIDPDDHTIRLLLAFAQCRLGQFAAAATLMDNLIEDKPSCAEAYLYRGMARMGMGRIGDAVADMGEAVKLNPASTEAHYDLAQALLLRTPPDIAGAQRHYRKALDLGGKPDADIEARIKAAANPK